MRIILKNIIEIISTKVNILSDLELHKMVNLSINTKINNPTAIKFAAPEMGRRYNQLLVNPGNKIKHL